MKSQLRMACKNENQILVLWFKVSNPLKKTGIKTVIKNHSLPFYKSPFKRGVFYFMANKKKAPQLAGRRTVSFQTRAEPFRVLYIYLCNWQATPIGVLIE